MTTELQAVIDRLDHMERQARGWKLLVVVAILIAAASSALPILHPMSAIDAFFRPRALFGSGSESLPAARRGWCGGGRNGGETRWHDPLRARVTAQPPPRSSR